MQQTGSKTLIVDGDLLVYRCGFAADKRVYRARRNGRIEAEYSKKKEMDGWISATIEDGDKLDVSLELIPEPVENALHNVSGVIDGLVDKFPGCPMEFYITGKDNYRDSLATLLPYKGNRVGAPKPTHYQAIRDFLVRKYKAMVVDGQEADDAVGISATAHGDAGCIVSVDKDLDTIPGWHYNWVKKELYHVDEKEAVRNFYTQVLTGDSTDNIPGIEGVGPITAKELLKGYAKPKALYQVCLDTYNKHYPYGYRGRDVKTAMHEIATLLYIRHFPDEMWEAP